MKCKWCNGPVPSKDGQPCPTNTSLGGPAKRWCETKVTKVTKLYVTRTVVYCGLPDPECGHHSTPESAYKEIACQMWFDAEKAGRVPKMSRIIRTS